MEPRHYGKEILMRICPPEPDKKSDNEPQGVNDLRFFDDFEFLFYNHQDDWAINGGACSYVIDVVVVNIAPFKDII